MFFHIVSCVETRMQGKAHKIRVVQDDEHANRIHTTCTWKMGYGIEE